MDHLEEKKEQPILYRLLGLTKTASLDEIVKYPLNLEKSIQENGSKIPSR